MSYGVHKVVHKVTPVHGIYKVTPVHGVYKVTPVVHGT